MTAVLRSPGPVRTNRSAPEDAAAEIARIEDAAKDVIARIDGYDDPALWIFRPPTAEVLAKARTLDETGCAERPLAGMTFAVKDNIDVAGWPTTAACPDFSYQAEASARVIELLEAAGAVCVGKTNLDQFATGLVGVRSPQGTPRNVIAPDRIPGGSSSGSAVAVAAGLVDFALGTDTAGSGRVPAACNGIVGLKPTPGLVSARGVVPACRSLDCVSIFARDIGTAARVLDVIAAYDADDSYCVRPFGNHGHIANAAPIRRLAVPTRQWRQFDGPSWSDLFDSAIAQAQARGAEIVEVDFSVLDEVQKLLYEGPWLAERLAAVGDFASANPDSLYPITKTILEKGAELTAVDAFRGMYRLKELARQAERIFETCDGLLVPSVPEVYSLDEIAADPIGLNSRLGTYTNFVNLLGWSALAIPFAKDARGLSFGVTLIGPAFSEARLCASAQTLFADGSAEQISSFEFTGPSDQSSILIAVAGAHMRGLALNHQLRDLGASFVESAETAQTYRMYLLKNEGLPPRPGLVRTLGAEGCAIAVEVWSLPIDKMGHFMGHVRPPLAIGTIELGDGRQMAGFVCEGHAAQISEDISHHGSWRSFLARSPGI